MLELDIQKAKALEPQNTDQIKLIVKENSFVKKLLSYSSSPDITFFECMSEAPEITNIARDKRGQERKRKERTE